MNKPLNADDLATALTSGGAGWMVLSVAAILPILWSFTLVMHFARPYVVRFLQSLTLRFGGDVWWLSYVLIRDALLVVTLGLSMIFLYPNFYLTGDGLPITAPVATVLLFWVLIVKLIRDMDDDPAVFRLVSLMLVAASVFYIVPQIYGMEAADQENLSAISSALVSTSNLDVAKPIFWGSLAVFFLTAGAIFTRFVYYLWRPARRSAAGGGEAVGEAA